MNGATRGWAVRLTIRTAIVDAKAGDGPFALWSVLFAAPVPAPGSVGSALVAWQPRAVVAQPLRTNPRSDRPRELRPADAGAGSSRFVVAPEFGRWCVGAAALLLHDERVRPGALPTREPPQAVDDFRRRMAAVLTNALGPETMEQGSLFAPVKTDNVPAPRPPKPGSALARLIAGPAHAVIGDLVDDEAVRRLDAIEAVRLVSRPQALLAPDARRASRPTSPDARRESKVVVASSLSARILASYGDGGIGTARIPLDAPLIDSSRRPIATLQGDYWIRQEGFDGKDST